MSNTDFDPAAFINTPQPAVPTTPPAQDTGTFDPAKFLAGGQESQPPATPAAATAPTTPHQRLTSIKQGMAAESPETPAGWGTPDVTKTPSDAPASGDLVRMWKDVGKGLPKGLAAAVTGGIVGDMEGSLRLLLAPYGVGQQTAFPTSVEGGPILGQRGFPALGVDKPKGLGVIGPPSSPEEAGGRQIGSMLLPFLPKWMRDVRETVVRPSPPEPLPQTYDPATPRVDTRGQRVSPDLLPPDTPHQPLPATAPAGAATISPLADLDPAAVQQVHNSLTEAGFTSGSLEQRLAEMSPHEFGFEVGGPDAAPYRSANGLIQVGGQGGQDVASAMRQRLQEAPQRVETVLNNAFGGPEDLSMLKRSIQIDQQKAATPLYQQFHDLKIQPTPEMKDLIPRLRAAGAFSGAQQLARLKGVPWDQSFFTTGPQKSFPTAESWDMVKRALDAKIESSMAANNGRPSVWTRQYSGLKSDLVNAIDNHPDPNVAGVWKQAREAFAGPQQIQNALDLGGKVLTEKIPANELPFLTATYSDAQMAAVRQGIRNYLNEKAGRPGNTTPQVVKQLLGPNNQAKLRWFLGDEKADELVKGLNHEQDMYVSPRAPLHGSPTMRNASDAAQWQAQPSTLQSTMSNVSQLVRHPVGTVAGGTIDRIHNFLNESAQARMARVRDDAAKIYTMQGPQRDAVFQWILDHGANYTGRARGGAVKDRAAGGRVDDSPYPDPSLIEKTSPALPISRQTGGDIPENEPPTGTPSPFGAITSHPVLQIGVGPGFVGSQAPGAAPAPTKPTEEVPTPVPAEPAPPLYSAVEKAVQSAPQNSASRDQWQSYLENHPGVKSEELDQVGLPEFGPPVRTGDGSIVEGPITKDQLLSHIGDNKTRLEEAWKRVGSAFDALTPAAQNELVESLDFPPDTPHDARLEQARESYDEINAQPSSTRFSDSDLQLPNGNNYRELLLKIPLASSKLSPEGMPPGFKLTDENQAAREAGYAVPADAPQRWSYQSPHAGSQIFNDRAQAIVDAQRTAKQYPDAAQFNSSHWPDDPNTLMHLRMNDRAIPGVGNSLHLEELQSDWHQKARGIRDTEIKGIADRQGISKQEAAKQVPSDFGYGSAKLPEPTKIAEGIQPIVDSTLREGGFSPADYDVSVKYRKPLGGGVGGLPSGGHMYDLVVTPKETIKGIDRTDLHDRLENFTHYEGRPVEIAGRRFNIGDGDDTAAVTHDPDGTSHIWLRSFATNNPVPDAPFKDTNDWATLGLKRAIAQAAKEGKDAVSWTPGQQQADRYDLSKHVKSISYQPKTGRLLAWPKEYDPHPVVDKVVPQEKLSDHIGKDAADKIINNPTSKQSSGDETWHTIQGNDLKVGGSGMKKFYDEMLPNIANKIGKKYGTKVEWQPLGIGAKGSPLYKSPTGEITGGLSVHVLRLTPQLKAKALQEGFSMYARGGAVRGEQQVNIAPSNVSWSGASSGSAFARGGRVVASNINHNPSGAQKEAGNYAKDHIRIHGLDIAIENAKGSTRQGRDHNGKVWRSTLPSHYGYIKRTEGSDGDHVDVYLGPHNKSNKAYVIDQVDHKTKAFDEHKVLLGFGAKQQAINIYKKAFSDGKGLERIGAIHEMPIDQLKTWLKGDTTKPLSRTVSDKKNMITREAFQYHENAHKDRCGICRYWSGSTEGCGLFRMLNQRMPEDFALNVKVPDTGWCSAFINKKDKE